MHWPHWLATLTFLYIGRNVEPTEKFEKPKICLSKYKKKIQKSGLGSGLGGVFFQQQA